MVDTRLRQWDGRYKVKKNILKKWTWSIQRYVNGRGWSRWLKISSREKEGWCYPRKSEHVYQQRRFILLIVFDTVRSVQDSLNSLTLYEWQKKNNETALGEYKIQETGLVDTILRHTHKTEEISVVQKVGYSAHYSPHSE